MKIPARCWRKNGKRATTHWLALTKSVLSGKNRVRRPSASEQTLRSVSSEPACLKAPIFLPLREPALPLTC